MMKVDLDNLDALSKLDPSNMLGAVERFPDPLVQRSDVGLDLRGVSRIRSVILMGMGGSASAGDVAIDWLRSQLKIPAVVLREPEPPGFVNSKTLFVAISYSGDTLETLAAFNEARRRRARVVGIGTGGKLKDLCAKFGSPFIDVEAALAPRAALSQLLVAVATTLESFALVRPISKEIHEAGRELEFLRRHVRVQSPTQRNPAKRLASNLLGRLIVLYSLQRMGSVARRFKNQLAENSKEVAKYDVIPESCHNEIEAWIGPPDGALPVFIRGGVESRFERSVIGAFRSTISAAAEMRPIDVRIPGKSRLSRLLLPIYLLDYTSVYFALLKRVDPTPTNLILRYKAALRTG